MIAVSRQNVVLIQKLENGASLMRYVFAACRWAAGSLLTLMMCFGGNQSLAQVTVLKCAAQKTATPPNIMFLANSDAELSPPGQVLASASATQRTIYGLAGTQVHFAISTQSLSGVKSLTLTIPPAGPGTGTFHADAPVKGIPVCSLSMPPLRVLHQPPPLVGPAPALTLNAGGVYPVTAVGVDRKGVTSTVEATYKVLEATIGPNPYNPLELDWSGTNAAQVLLYVNVPGIGARLIPNEYPYGATVVSPGTYMVVVLSPNITHPPVPSPSTCGTSDTADAICRQYTMPPGTPPASAGLVEASFKFYFAPSPGPCDPSMTGVVVVQGHLQENNGTLGTFVAVATSNYTCERATLGSISQTGVIAVPPGTYYLSAQSSVGGSARCLHGIFPNGADVDFNGNAAASEANITQGVCDGPMH